MSRLTERLAAAEGELAQLKRSCQFTALTEMLSAGEEYANEVMRAAALFGRSLLLSLRGPALPLFGCNGDCSCHHVEKETDD